MATTTRKLGDYIVESDTRVGKNSQYSLKHIRGISSMTKLFQETKANLVDVSPAGYKIVRPLQFAFNPNTARMGDKIPIALNSEKENVLVSSIYPVFEISDTDKLDPQYLWLWFKRPEFDRYARFKSHGSAREIFTWEEMCNVELPVPSIEKQHQLVHQHQTIVDRIDLLQKVNENLEEVAYLYFRKLMSPAYGQPELPDGWKCVELQDLCDVKGGKRLPVGNELSKVPTAHPYIRVGDIGASRYTCLTEQVAYVPDEVYKSISRYIVNTDDIIISVVGTIGLIGKVHHSLDGANLTENCVKLANIQDVSSDFLYYTLHHKQRTKEIELLTVGAVQPKLPIYNIQSIKVLVPPEEVLQKFQYRINHINQMVAANAMEIQKLHSLVHLFLDGAITGERENA